jgi:hypothetical protein
VCPKRRIGTPHRANTSDRDAASRYRFMLEESRYTIMGFIKGPVCRGQVALNSIQDHFWVTFVDPENEDIPMLDAFLM